MDREKEETKENLASLLKSAVLRRRRDSGMDINKEEEEESPRSPWKVEDQF